MIRARVALSELQAYVRRARIDGFSHARTRTLARFYLRRWRRWRWQGPRS